MDDETARKELETRMRQTAAEAVALGRKRGTPGWHRLHNAQSGVVVAVWYGLGPESARAVVETLASEDQSLARSTMESGGYDA